MAQYVFTNGYCSINAVDLTAYVTGITLDVGAELQDKTTLGDTTRESIAGLKTWSLTVDFTQDFGAALVDATLFPLIGAAAFTVEVRPASGGRSATNPGYNGSVVLESYNPIAGSVARCQATFRSAGALTRSTV